MSIYGEWLTGTIASGGTSTDAINLGKDYEFIQVILPTLTAGTLKVQVSATFGGTYQDLGSGITTASTTGAYSDVWKIGGYQFIKIVSSGEQAGARSISVRGMRV